MKNIPEYFDATEPFWLSVIFTFKRYSLLIIFGVLIASKSIPLAIAISIIYILFDIITGNASYKSIRDHAYWLAKHQIHVLKLNPKELLIRLCNDTEINQERPRSGPRGLFYTPNQLSLLGLKILRYPPEMSSYMVLRKIPKLKANDIGLRSKNPRGLSQDLMMTFERLDLIYPEKKDKVYHFLATSLLMDRSIYRAKKKFYDLGRYSLNLPREEMAIANPNVRSHVRDVLFSMVEPLANKMIK